MAVVAAIGYEVLALSYAVGGRGAMSGMWRAELGQLTRAGLLLGSVVAFALALRARTGGQSRALLWLPLATLPVMLTMGLGLGALLA